MKNLLDLSRPLEPERCKVQLQHVHLKSSQTEYTAAVYQYDINSMAGTYIDFPGHILETDNGLYADSPGALQKFYQQDTLVIHLNRALFSGAVSADELQRAAGTTVDFPCVVINALGAKDAGEGCDGKPNAGRSVWLDASAVQWIIDRKCHLLVSDIYESPRLEGVFGSLFAAGISTVCMPSHLYDLPSRAQVSAIFLPIPKAAQLPCRLLAEF